MARTGSRPRRPPRRARHQARRPRRGMGKVTGAAGLLSGAMRRQQGLRPDVRGDDAGPAGHPLRRGRIKSAGDFQSCLVKLVTTAGESRATWAWSATACSRWPARSASAPTTWPRACTSSSRPGFHGADGLKVLKASAQGARQEQADLGTSPTRSPPSCTTTTCPPVRGRRRHLQLIQAVSHGKTTFEELTASLHSITPLASALHIPLSDIVGSLAAMTASGESADQATENMRNALMSLQQPNSRAGAGRSSASARGPAAGRPEPAGSRRHDAGHQPARSRAKMGPAGKIMLDALNQSITPGAACRADARAHAAAAGQAVPGSAGRLVNIRSTARTSATWAARPAPWASSS
jgi:hypothetical protein